MKNTFGFVEGSDPPGPIGTPPMPQNQKNKKKNKGTKKKENNISRLFGVGGSPEKSF